MIFTTYGRSMMCQVCGVMFAHVGDYCSSTLKPRGLDGTRWQKERRGSLPTDPISLGMIWKTNFGLITISMLGAPGVLQRTNYGGYVNQLLPWSFLVSKEYFLACMPRFERKSKSYRCSLLVVSMMYQIAGKRSGSKPMMVLLSHSCPHCIGPWLLPAEDDVRAGDCRYSPRLVRDLLWCLVVCGGFFLLLVLLFTVPDLSFCYRCLTMTSHCTVQWLPLS